MRIAHYGTFDVANYGDLLFPLLIEHNLPEHEFVHVSPTAGRPVWHHARRTVVPDDVGDIDAVVVGGGDILYGGQRVIGAYAGLGPFVYPGLWLGATAEAVRQRVPLIFNSPGARHPGPTHFLAGSVQRAAAYVAVRDRRSADLLGWNCQIVPDTALGISHMWAPDVLAERNRSLTGGGRTIVLHPNRRFIQNPAETATIFDGLARLHDATPVVLAIGPCHGDSPTVRDIAGLMRSGPIAIDTPDDTKDVAAVLAHAVAYVGTSLHGFITAVSYGVPAHLVTTVRGETKFTGFASHVHAKGAISGSWSAASAAAPFDRAYPVSDAWNRLDQHWDNVRSGLNGPPAAAGQMLRHWEHSVPTVGRATQTVGRLHSKAAGLLQTR